MSREHFKARAAKLILMLRLITLVVVLLTQATSAPAGAPPDPSSSCALSTPGSTIGMTLSGCAVLMSDTASNPDPRPLWGTIECETSSRHQQVMAGGDAHRQADGAPQRDAAFRRLTLFDGDEFSGERCELGKNDHRDGPTVFYPEGARKATYASYRLPSTYPLGASSWQLVMQMKHTQPTNLIGSPPVELDAYDGRWLLYQAGPGLDDGGLKWSAPARKEIWTRFAFDVVYSVDPSIGSITVYADLNGDGDFADRSEHSPTIRASTLKPEVGDDDSDGYAAGEAVQSHLRVGLYHDPTIDCPAPLGCSVEVDNVQVLSP